uniref:Uncharacterized protein n=1 Tax=Anguilla anguilla TaxID=7936 RepID=A0A0E9PQQ3_ANGAN
MNKSSESSQLWVCELRSPLRTKGFSSAYSRVLIFSLLACRFLFRGRSVSTA